MKLIIKYFAIVFTFFILSNIFDSVEIGSTGSLFMVALILLVVNLLVKPILLIITLPVSILTLGLFSFIVNAWTIMLADAMVPSFHIGGFWNALIAACAIAIFNHALRDSDKYKRA